MSKWNHLLLCLIFLLSLCISALFITHQASNLLLELFGGSILLSGIVVCIGCWKLSKTWRKRMIAPLLLLVLFILNGSGYFKPPITYTADLLSDSMIVIGALGLSFAMVFFVISFRFLWKSLTLPKQDDSGAMLFALLFLNACFKGALLADANFFMEPHPTPGKIDDEAPSKTP